ncbi:hypothetical protein HDV05_004386 [Chytridiales sp. JEL 0842]|nr:hypothetical protein HDV05_004386 [Chytridiales sp. JEL 0842]
MFLSSTRSSTTSRPKSIPSEEYLISGSLLKGSCAPYLPASAGLPSAGGGMFKPAPESNQKESKHAPSSAGRSIKRPQAIYVKTARDQEVGRWSSGILKEARTSISSTASSVVKHRNDRASTSGGRRKEGNSEESSCLLTSSKGGDNSVTASNTSNSHKSNPTIKNLETHTSSSSPRRSTNTTTTSALPTSSDLLTSLTHPTALGSGLPPAVPDASTTRGWESMKAHLTSKSSARVSKSWADLNAEHLSKRGGEDCMSIPGLKVSRKEQSRKPFSARGKRDAGEVGGMMRSLEGVLGMVNERRRMKDHVSGSRHTREEAALQLKVSLEAEKKARNADWKVYLHQRDQVLTLNHVIQMIEDAKIADSFMINPDLTDEEHVEKLKGRIEGLRKKVPLLGGDDLAERLVKAVINDMRKDSGEYV